MKRVIGLLVVLLLAFPVAASATLDPTEATPDGPATVVDVFNGGIELGAWLPYQVLTKVRVRVGAGGRPGLVRFRAGGKVGEWVTLPAEPGAYEFPAPHVELIGPGQLYGLLGMDQQTGGHVVIGETVDCPVNCTPCDSIWFGCTPFSVYEYAGDPASSTPTAKLAGRQLTIDALGEPDVDRDLRGDQTEDRTDLRLSAATTLDEHGHARTAITVKNAGPLRADVPMTGLTLPEGVTVHWDGCTRHGRGAIQWLQLSPINRPRAGALTDGCLIAPLESRASRTVTLTTSASKKPIKLVALAEGPDLKAADNAVQVPLVVASGSADRIRLALAAKGKVRIVLAMKVRGHVVRVTRTLFARPTVFIHPGAVLRHARSGQIVVTRLADGARAVAPIRLRSSLTAGRR